jgi:hypothetical protein
LVPQGTGVFLLSLFFVSLAAGNGMMKIYDGAVLAMIDDIPLVKVGKLLCILSVVHSVHDIHDTTGILCTSLLLYSTDV